MARGSEEFQGWLSREGKYEIHFTVKSSIALSKKFSYNKWSVKCILSQGSDSNGCSRNEFHQPPNNEILGDYSCREPVKDLSEVVYIPCAIWVLDEQTSGTYEMPVALPETWFSEDFKYVRLPGGSGWIPTYAEYQKSLKSFGTTAREKSIKRVLVDGKDDSDLYERDVSRFLGAYGCESVF